MPVRSLSSPVLRWPDAETVDRAVRRWAEAVALSHSDVLGIGYFGSYARGDWGVGSDVDLVVVVGKSAQPFFRRAAAWDATELPVPADVLVYTGDEWRALVSRGSFGRRMAGEMVWVLEKTNGQWIIDNGQLIMDSGQWIMDNEQWIMDNG